MINFKDRLKEAMEANGYSQTKLGQLSGIYVGTINNYLKGKYIPKSDKIYILAEVLNVSPAWLTGFDVPMNRDSEEAYLKDQFLKNEKTELIESISLILNQMEIKQVRKVLEIIRILNQI